MSKEVNTSKELSTEEKIKQAAAKVFVHKGYAATKTRDIAEEAGINIASLHYYYRSKDKLFELVIGEALKRFSKMMDSTFNNDMPLHEKIKIFVEKYIDFIRENPMVPLFIVAESQHNPETVDKLMANERTLDKLESQFEELVEQGAIRKMHHAQFMMNMVSLTIFPFLMKPLLLHKVGLSLDEYNDLLEERKEIIPEMIINYLYLKKPT
ncbi:TetR/AcrR family transcriptional regulator [Tunicatimonas pelagia]|uniref:TetR/AcrR family transcriptional regulator n=1 Tax=Tunicatimonas pelagia TaxID=931531 RepID=UPI0026671ABF|nr:TetR family transcriptional regulator [Tunicatimonas pelagia]WKN42595.1 TetR family transcriptional regulator [Tunicatimonas pelagia]